MKIKVCIPFYNEFDTAKPGLKELRNSKNHDFEIKPISGVYIATARNGAVRRWDTCDYYLFIDSDIGFTEQTVLDALARKKSVLSVPYTVHGSDTVYQCGTADKKGIINHKFTTEEKGLRKIDWCGGGFLLVKRSVFKKCKFPWFSHPLVKKDDKFAELGEDVAFSLKLKANKIDLWCDFDIKINHIPKRSGSIEFDLDTVKLDPMGLMKKYKATAQKYLIESEKEKSKMLAMAEYLGWSQVRLNKFLE